MSTVLKAAIVCAAVALVAAAPIKPNQRIIVCRKLVVTDGTRTVEIKPDEINMAAGQAGINLICKYFGPGQPQLNRATIRCYHDDEKYMWLSNVAVMRAAAQESKIAWTSRADQFEADGQFLGRVPLKEKR